MSCFEHSPWAVWDSVLHYLVFQFASKCSICVTSKMVFSSSVLSDGFHVLRLNYSAIAAVLSLSYSFTCIFTFLLLISSFFLFFSLSSFPFPHLFFSFLSSKKCPFISLSREIENFPTLTASSELIIWSEDHHGRIQYTHTLAPARTHSRRYTVTNIHTSWHRCTNINTHTQTALTHTQIDM